MLAWLYLTSHLLTEESLLPRREILYRAVEFNYRAKVSHSYGALRRGFLEMCAAQYVEPLHSEPLNYSPQMCEPTIRHRAFITLESCVPVLPSRSNAFLRLGAVLLVKARDVPTDDIRSLSAVRQSDEKTIPDQN